MSERHVCRQREGDELMRINFEPWREAPADLRTSQFDLLLDLKADLLTCATYA